MTEKNEIILRETARFRGLLRYYTGKPCKNGHIAERFTSNGRCIECQNIQRHPITSAAKERIKKWREKNPENVRRWSRDYHNRKKKDE
jgi:hypothetical protein